MLKSLLKVIITKSSRKMLVPKWGALKYKGYLRKIKEEIFDYYKNVKSHTEEKSKILDYFIVNALIDSQCACTEKQQRENITIYEDESNGLKYVLRNFFFDKQTQAPYFRSALIRSNNLQYAKRCSNTINGN